MARFGSTCEATPGAVSETVQFTAEQEVIADAKSNKFIAGKPLSQWKLDMEALDKEMPRYHEDDLADQVTDGRVLRGRLKANYDEKVRLRGTKP